MPGEGADSEGRLRTPALAMLARLTAERYRCCQPLDDAENREARGELPEAWWLVEGRNPRVELGGTPMPGHQEMTSVSEAGKRSPARQEQEDPRGRRLLALW